jgi:hypothetical protein
MQSVFLLPHLNTFQESNLPVFFLLSLKFSSSIVFQFLCICPLSIKQKDSMFILMTRTLCTTITCVCVCVRACVCVHVCACARLRACKGWASVHPVLTLQPPLSIVLPLFVHPSVNPTLLMKCRTFGWGYHGSCIVPESSGLK